MNKTKIKRSLPRLLRRLIQIGSFILMPGLFISTFSAIKDVYTAIITGAFSISALSYQLMLLLAVIPITVIMGRFFCGYLCAFGSMGDFLWFVSNKIHKRKVNISDKADRVLKLLKYALLLFIVIFSWTLGVVAFASTASPWTIFGMYFSLSGWPSASYLLSIGAALLVLIIIGSFFVERFFCRYLCPLGAVYSIISLPRLFRIKKPGKDCGACTLCTQSCAMGIPLYQADQVNSGECINCFQCVEACPRENVKANPAPAAAATMAAASIAGLYYVGDLSAVTTTESVATTSVRTIADVSSGSYTDGVYTGSAAGYRGTTEVQVTVSDGELSDIEVLSTDDDYKYFSRVESRIINNILVSQSTDVSTVSGATFSSYAIINAVKDALGDSDSVVISSETETASASAVQEIETEENSSSGSAAEEYSGTYTDGVYTGSGTGFRGDTTVSVTVSGGVIAAITVVSTNDDAKYFDRAESSVISAILSQQSIDVSTVSGATFSSNGIIEAVANALSVDFTNPNSRMQEAGMAHGHKGRP